MVACSNAKASFIKSPSLKAVPAKVMPKGLPLFIYPVGTAMDGYPALALIVDPIYEGKTIASRSYLLNA